MRERRIEATRERRNLAHEKIVAAREQVKRRIAEETKKEFLERYNSFHGNMLSAQHRLLEAISNPEHRLTVQEAQRLEKLIHEGFKVKTFFKTGMESWRGQQHNLGAFLVELASKLSEKKLRQGTESPSFKQRRAQFRQKIGWRFKFGKWQGRFEEAYLRVNLEANAMASAEYAKLFEANASTEENIQRIQTAKIDMAKIELSAVNKVFGKQALAEFLEWKKDRPQGTISDYLMDIVSGMH